MIYKKIIRRKKKIKIKYLKIGRNFTKIVQKTNFNFQK